MRDAVQEVMRAVERIDVPAVGLVRAFDNTTFFQNETVAFSSISRRISSERWSAFETKSPGPLRSTCSCSTSPKSRFSVREAFNTASVITVISGERIMCRLSLGRLSLGGLSSASVTAQGRWRAGVAA
jgi:hypothetical protein